MTARQTVPVRLTQAGLDAIDARATQRGLTRSDVIRAALAFALNHPGFERGWRDYQPTDGRRRSQP